MGKSQVYLEIAEQIAQKGIHFVSSKTGYSHNELLGILDYAIHVSNISKKQNRIYQNLLKQNHVLLALNEQRIGVISDTHIGSEFANWNYIYRTKEFLEREGVNVSFHTGDVLDGYHKYLESLYSKEELYDLCVKQVKEFCRNYPTDFSTIMILGNHDEILEKMGINLIAEFSKTHPNIQVLGTGQAYLVSNQHLISLSHSVSNASLHPPLIHGCDVSLIGHSHFYRWYPDHRIKVPTCSDNHPDAISSESHEPGFLILTIEERRIFVERFAYRNDNIELVLRRKL